MGLLDEQENEAALEFARSHYRNHCHRKNGAEAVDLVARQTGMGFTILVRCPYCREEKNITNFESY